MVRELWKSDGTAAGTVMVKDINLDPYSWGGSPRNLTDVNGTLFFAADDDVHGFELWKSDGTADGTVMVREISELSYSTIRQSHECEWRSFLHGR